jgi:hypothetical protein
MPQMTTFHQSTPTLDSYWRAIILFGRNVASYKFALAKTLLEKAEQGTTKLLLEDLAEPFSRHVCEHISRISRQSTAPSSKFLDACRDFNLGKLDPEKLRDTTVRFGFNNVIDAFHVVNQGDVGVRFFSDERRSGGGVLLTDEIFRLKDTLQGGSLEREVEARWRLVETAWSLNLSRNLVAIDTDSEANTLFVRGNRRVAITSSRDALNGYQKGRCFYCFDEITVLPDHPKLADVDHFFPWTLKREARSPDLDGVWNLVLACRSCNRGEGGKMARVPSLPLVQRLHRRNNYLIDSHHPLRETLMLQTGVSDLERHDFLQQRFDEAVGILIHTWEPEALASSLF